MHIIDNARDDPQSAQCATRNSPALLIDADSLGAEGPQWNFGQWLLAQLDANATIDMFDVEQFAVQRCGRARTARQQPLR